MRELLQADKRRLRITKYKEKTQDRSLWRSYDVQEESIQRVLAGYVYTYGNVCSRHLLWVNIISAYFQYPRIMCLNISEYFTRKIIPFA